MFLGYLFKLIAKLLLPYFSYRFWKGINQPISHSLHFGILRIARPLHGDSSNSSDCRGCCDSSDSSVGASGK